MLTTATLQELAQLLGFLGNEQRLRILKSVTGTEKYAQEIAQDLKISRSLVNIYLKQLERKGLVTGRTWTSEDPPVIRRYYRAVPFEIRLDLETIQSLHEEHDKR
jgi:ArsR family transcriptional regulator